MELAAAVINHPGKHLMTRDEEEEKVKHRKWKTLPRAFVSDRFCIYRPSWAKPRISTVGKPSCNCFMCWGFSGGVRQQCPSSSLTSSINLLHILGLAIAWYCANKCNYKTVWSIICMGRDSVTMLRWAPWVTSSQTSLVCSHSFALLAQWWHSPLLLDIELFPASSLKHRGDVEGLENCLRDWTGLGSIHPCQ